MEKKRDTKTRLLNQNVKANAKYFVSVVVFRIFFVDEDLYSSSNRTITGLLFDFQLPIHFISFHSKIFINFVITYRICDILSTFKWNTLQLVKLTVDTRHLLTT